MFHAGIGDDGLCRNGFTEHHPFERLAPAQRHIGLSGRKSSVDINDGMLKSQSLALVDGDGPCEPERILLEDAYDVFFYLLRTAVHLVACVRPCVNAHLYRFVTIKREHYDTLFRQLFHRAQHAVKVAMLHIVLDKHDLGAFLEHEFVIGRERRLGKGAFNVGFKHVLFCG